MHLGCDQHNLEDAYFYPIDNPYYAIVGAEGTYSIDKVPVGKYKLVAWHPVLGQQEREIEVGLLDKVAVDFEFTN